LIDFLLRRFGREHDWFLAVLLGVTFVAVMFTVHWYWSAFLLSSGARNYVFGVDHWEYYARLGAWRYQYWNLDGGAVGTFKWGRVGDVADAFKPVLFARGLGVAMVVAVVSSRLGLWWGNWMTMVKR
jgi:hypothetical protein